MRRLPVLAIAACSVAFGVAPAARAETLTVTAKVLSVDKSAKTMIATICGIAGQYTVPFQDPNVPPLVGRVYQAVIELGPPLFVVSSTLLSENVPCGVVGQTGPSVGQTPGQTPGHDDSPAGLAADLPGAAFSRVFTFNIEVDGFDDGEISATISSIKGLSRSLKEDFNDAIDDQDAIVLVSGSVKVFNAHGKRVKRSRLDNADTASVKGKLLRPKQWHDDADGNPVPTIRAKRVTITG